MRIFIALLLVSTSACITFTPPDRFLVVRRGIDELKAITPEESKLWIRSFDDDDKGGLAFWRDALKTDLKDNRGYVVISEADVKDGANTPGKEMVLESTVNGRPMRELMDVFVYGGWLSDTIRVVEYVAEKPRFDAEIEGVRKSVSTLKP
jgi:hypothetical protein